MTEIERLKEDLIEWERDGMCAIDPDVIRSLITTIESQKEDIQAKRAETERLFEYIRSQKEEIAKKDAALLAWMEREDMLKRLYDRLESKKLIEQKAITELAVKGLDESKIAFKWAVEYHINTCTCPECNALGSIEFTLSEIERLQNGGS